MKGVITIIAGTGATLMIQTALKRLPYSLKWKFLLSVVAGGLAGYTVTKRESEKCVRLWIFLETARQLQPHDTAPQQMSDTNKSVRRKSKYGDEID